MTIKHSQLLIVIALLVLGLVWVTGFWFTEVFRTRANNEPNRKALLQIHAAVAIGAPHAEVLAAYWKHRTDGLRLVADTPTAWWMTMPAELGATDWLLLIEFKDQRVTSVQLRTADGPPPKEGPQHK
jgi:hypothetical protein